MLQDTSAAAKELKAVKETKSLKPWPCPTQRYLRADLAVINHPDIFKWRFAKRGPKVQVTATPVPTQKPDLPIRRPDDSQKKPLPIKTVYFDYDKSVLKPEAKAAIQTNVQFLKENPETKVFIDGHCDERGTNEYNLALGERRAESVKNYMVDLGIAADRITTKSWGEEQPVDPGHNEAAWKQNRRAEMYYTGEAKPGSAEAAAKAAVAEPVKEMKKHSAKKAPVKAKKPAPAKAVKKAPAAAAKTAPMKEEKKEAAKPAAPAMKPAEKPAAPAVQPAAKPAEKPAVPANQPAVKPVAQPNTPAAQPAAQPAQPAAQPAAPATQPATK